MSANELALLRLGYRDACAERDDLARRCRELEAQRDAAIRAAGNTASANRKLLLERDTLRAEVERLREIREIASQCAANGGYLSSAGLIELRELLKK